MFLGETGVGVPVSSSTRSSDHTWVTHVDNYVVRADLLSQSADKHYRHMEGCEVELGVFVSPLPADARHIKQRLGTHLFTKVL